MSNYKKISEDNIYALENYVYRLEDTIIDLQDKIDRMEQDFNVEFNVVDARLNELDEIIRQLHIATRGQNG